MTVRSRLVATVLRDPPLCTAVQHGAAAGNHYGLRSFFDNRVVAASEPVASNCPRYAPKPLASCLSAVSTESADATMSELSGSAWREWICTT